MAEFEFRQPRRQTIGVDPYDGAGIQIDMDRLSGGLTLKVNEETITLTPEELMLAFRMIKRAAAGEEDKDTVPITSWLRR